MGSVEEDAKAMATAAHQGQFYGDGPYTVHLQSVRDILVAFGYEGELLVAAWLHDILEDTSVTMEEVQDHFGPMVASMVWAVTGIGPNRKLRNQAAYEKLRALPVAVTLKLADRIANSEASLKTNARHLEMYRREMPEFETALGEHGDPEMWDRLRAVLGTNRDLD